MFHFNLSEQFRGCRPVDTIDHAAPRARKAVWLLRAALVDIAYLAVARFSGLATDKYRPKFASQRQLRSVLTLAQDWRKVYNRRVLFLLSPHRPASRSASRPV
jgi:hypothetical protein